MNREIVQKEHDFRQRDVETRSTRNTESTRLRQKMKKAVTPILV